VSSGTLYAALAYVLWGIFPLYFKLLHAVDASEILAQRMAWTMAVVLVLLALLRRWSWLSGLASGGARLWLTFAASAVLISINWGTYIWSVNAGHVLDASLGYFINPLVSVMLGALVLGERLRPAQWGAIAVAAAGVVELGIVAGAPPWIGLVLATSFGTYGLLRKIASLGPLEGLALETALLFPFALGYLGWLGAHGELAFASAPWTLRALLLLSGAVTAVPLLLFTAGARRIPLAQLGVLQYIAPTLQWLLGALLYGEPAAPARIAGFALIWIAIAIYTAEGAWRHSRGSSQASDAEAPA